MTFPHNDYFMTLVRCFVKQPSVISSKFKMAEKYKRTVALDSLFTTVSVKLLSGFGRAWMICEV